MNISKIEKRMKKIQRGAQIIAVDSKEWVVTDKDYLPGGLLNVIFNRSGPLLQKKMVKKGKLGNWSAILLEYKGKRLEIINLYRLPISSSNGVYCSLTQYNLVNGKLKSTSEYRRELLNEIKQHIHNEKDITDIIIAGDYN